MTESDLHKEWKGILCGCNIEETKTEQRVESNRILDCLNEPNKICGEVEFNKSRIPYAIDKLEEAVDLGLCNEPRLVVKVKDLEFAKSLVENNNIKIIPVDDINQVKIKCKTIGKSKVKTRKLVI